MKTPRSAIVFVLTLLLCLPGLCVCAQGPDAGLSLELGLPLRDHAVLQRGIDLPIWGKASPGAAVRVVFDAQAKSTVADQDGRWRVELEPLKAVRLTSASDKPEGKTLTVSATHHGQTESIKLNDLVVGDVWLCAGQSNIAGKLKGSGTYQGEVADYPGLRHWTPSDAGGWVVCSPQLAGEFKKTAFYFGRDVYREALVPIGLVVTAVGGSNIESWLNQEPYETGKNYKSLVEPIVGMGIRGMVWYQGESNANKAEPYRPLLTALIGGWREAWGQGDFPFYYVQLPGYGEASNEPAGQRAGWPALRQGQLETLAVKNTGMAVTIDIGDKSVHPPNKVDTGKRLARLALYHVYGLKDQAPAGPLYREHRIEGSAVRVRFDYATGLMLAEKQGLSEPTPTPDKALGCLSLQDKSGAWHPAQGRIENDELVITSDAVTEPVAARYAYLPRPAGPLLYNKDGLPASPFTTERAADDPKEANER